MGQFVLSARWIIEGVGQHNSVYREESVGQLWKRPVSRWTTLSVPQHRTRQSQFFTCGYQLNFPSNLGGRPCCHC